VHYSVTMRCIRATSAAVEKQYVLHFPNAGVCSLRYPAWNAHAPYCHLWPLRFYYISPHYLINGTVFEKKVTEYKMCVLIFSTNIVWKFLILRRTERDMIKHVYWPSCKVPVILAMFQWNLHFLNILSNNAHT